MAMYTVILPDGRRWVPKFIRAINPERCIGCGRCFKVCGRSVLKLMAVNDEGELISVDPDEDDEYEKKIMTIADAGDCVGCEACSRTCAKKSISHAPRELAS